MMFSGLFLQYVTAGYIVLSSFVFIIGKLKFCFIAMPFLSNYLLESRYFD